MPRKVANDMIPGPAAPKRNRAEFEAVAQSRYEEILAFGRTIPWAKMRRYLRARIAGEQARRTGRRRG